MDAFLIGHIPGAAYLDTNCLEEEPFWNKVADQELLRILLSLGICHDSTVVLYGRNTTAAARAAHLMLYAGVRDVRMLDGGYAAWQRAALPAETGAGMSHYPTATHFGSPFPGNPHYMVQTPQAKALLQSPGGVLASIRTWDEFTGTTSGYCYIKAKGDIPGARWGRAGEGGDMNSMSDFQQSDGTMKPPQEISEFWTAEGIHSGQSVAFYCGTGWRASLAFYYAWLMGWERIAVYDGGWFEWSSDPSNPVTQSNTPP
jgi:3-mercaptopyruvate sulfurtransferase SseA